MKLEGTVLLPAPPEQIWNLLLDPGFLAEIIPGCRALKQIGDDRFEGQIAAKIGPVSSQYSTRFTINDKNPPHSYRLHIEGEGQGSFMRAEGQVRLELEEGGTLLHYVGEGTVGGKIARIGQRLVEAAAKKLVQVGFKSLKKKIADRLQD